MYWTGLKGEPEAGSEGAGRGAEATLGIICGPYCQPRFAFCERFDDE
jgi:hypothetical protein